MASKSGNTGSVNIYIDTDLLSADLNDLKNYKRRLEQMYSSACDIVPQISSDATSKQVSSFEMWLCQYYTVDEIKSTLYMMVQAAAEVVSRWEYRLCGWINVDRKLAGTGEAASTPTNDDHPTDGDDDFDTDEYNPDIFTPEEDNWTPEDFGDGGPEGAWTPVDPNIWTPDDFDDDDRKPTDYGDDDDGPGSDPYDDGGWNSDYPTDDGGGNGGYSSGNPSFSAASTVSTGGGGSNWGNYTITNPYTRPGSSTFSSTGGNSPAFAVNTFSASPSFASAALSTYKPTASSYGDTSYGHNTSNKGINGGSASSAGTASTASTISSMASTIKRGVNRLASSIFPTGKNAAKSLMALGGLSAAGLAAGGAAIGGGMLLGSNSRSYIFIPEDFEKLDEETQTAVLSDFVNNGFSEEKIELFKEATFKIEASELNEHIKKVEKAYEQNVDFAKEYEEMYGFNLFNKDDKLDKYLLFLTLIIDGSNTTDEINIYNIINPCLEEDEVDFIYSGINMEEYIIDGDIEDDEENEDVKVDGSTEDDVPQALAWLREMEENT